jgi:hypothetical protein
VLHPGAHRNAGVDRGIDQNEIGSQESADASLAVRLVTLSCSSARIARQVSLR